MMRFLLSFGKYRPEIVSLWEKELKFCRLGFERLTLVSLKMRNVRSWDCIVSVLFFCLIKTFVQVDYISLIR